MFSWLPCPYSTSRFQTIHMSWSPGIKSKQTLADDERSVSVVISLKLAGSPWNQAVYNSGKATTQVRKDRKLETGAKSQF